MHSCPTPEELEHLLDECSEAGVPPALRRHLDDCELCARWVKDGRENRPILDSVRRVLRRDEIRGGAPAASPPEQIGEFRVLSVLGEGGMGVVYEAEQVNPRRHVALKVIRSGGGSTGHMRRLQHEAQLLARLQHPGIAQVFAAGVADTLAGPQPYIAMELVRGRRLSRFADEQRLDIRQRLAILAQVCDAVQHAHSHGVIHRDLKPGNILVDESGQPKVLDFGVARTTDTDVASMRTHAGQLVGTLAYMSPEQITADPAAVTTRSDVYSLGVVGYELLVGRLPHDPRRRSIAEAARVIRDEPPARPSGVHRALRGDVETILVKALEKAPARRYQSAGELAADIRRHLHSEPILARPPGALYQFSRFVRRNRGLMAGVGLALAGLLFGSAFAAWQAVQATSDRNRARIEAGKAQRINAFLHDILAAASPIETRHDMGVRELLDAAARRVGDELANEPEIEAAVRRTIGDAYAGITAYGQAIEHLRLSTELFERTLGADHPETAASGFSLAYVLALRGEFSEAQQRMEAILARLRAGGAAGRALLVAALDQMVEILIEKADFKRALPLAREALALSDGNSAGRDRQPARRQRRLGDVQCSLGDYPAAIEAYRAALVVERELHARPHRDTAWTLYGLGDSLRANGQLDEAEICLREALAMQQSCFAGDHIETAHTVTGLAWLALERGDAGEAERLHRESLAMRRRLFGDGDHVHTALQLRSLGRFFARIGRLEEAEAELRAALEMRRRLHTPDHPSIGMDIVHLADVLEGLGRQEDAATLRADGR